MTAHDIHLSDVGVPDTFPVIGQSTPVSKIFNTGSTPVNKEL